MTECISAFSRRDILQVFGMQTLQINENPKREGFHFHIYDPKMSNKQYLCNAHYRAHSNF